MWIAEAIVEGPTLAALALLVGAGGWIAGYFSAWATDLLLVRDGLSTSSARKPLVRDALVQGGLALVWAALLLVLGPGWHWLIAALLAIPLVQVSVTDLRVRYVYTAVALAGMLAGLVLSPLEHGAPWWTGLAGAAGGYVAFTVVYHLGRLLYRGQEPLARGDVTIAAMVGAIAGPHTAVSLVAGVVFSGLLATLVLVARRSSQAFMPYGPGLCLGGLLALFLG
jgi:prepilin signal peptidase PulO-like enzyme (type II secretory pathway)